MLKKVALGLLAVICAVLGVGFLLPASYEVERSVVIEREPADIYPLLASPKKWPEWSPWTKERYPNMTTTYSGQESGVGAKSAWTNPDSGNGSMVITEADPKDGIRYDLDFEGWSTSHGYLLLESSPSGGSTEVVMGMRGHLGANPIFRYFGLMMDSAMGAEFEEGLAKLKKVVEAKPKKPAGPTMAPTPFTAEEIRDATKPGRTYEFRMEAAGKPTTIQRIEFTNVTPESAVMKVTRADDSGAPVGEAQTKTITWEELRRHALYPQVHTRITKEEIEVPAGKFDCMLYTVTSEEGVRTKAWFAPELPGAPVRHEVSKDGEMVSKMILQVHTPGA